MRTPFGVSYVLENREIMMRLFPDAFAGQSISPVGNYPERLLENLRAEAPSGAEDPVVVLLTPGRYNSAYFEHVFLAEQMGIELVEGGDLFVRDGYVWMRTTEGPVPRRRFLHGSARLPLRLHARRAGPALGDPRRPGCACQRARHRRRRRQGDVCLRAAHAARFREQRKNDLIETLHEVMLAIADAVEYRKGETHVHTTSSEALEQGLASARTTPTSSAPSVARSTCPRAMSAAISATALGTRRMPRATPGPRPSWTISAGSASIPPIAPAPRMPIFAPRSGSTMLRQARCEG